MEGKDNIGQTPLFIACRMGNEAVMYYLVEMWTNINEQKYWTSYNLTPLDLAKIRKHKTIVNCLIEHGAHSREGIAMI